MIRLIGTTLLFIVAGGLVVACQDRIRKDPQVEKTASCRSGEFTFPCPADYRVLINGDRSDRTFFAKNNDFNFGVFVFYELGEKTIVSVLPAILKELMTTESEKFRWKGLTPDSRASSKFETAKGRMLGTNGHRLVTVEFREITFNEKKLVSGTIVAGSQTGAAAETAFNEGHYTSSDACSDSLEVIHAFTGETLTNEVNPCAWGSIPVR